GSTECIIGRGFQAVERESLQVGCIATTRRFFGNGKLSKKKWREAVIEVGAEFQQFANTYSALGWNEAIGASGTNKASGEVCAAMQLSRGAVAAEAPPQVRGRLQRLGGDGTLGQLHRGADLADRLVGAGGPDRLV